jgi:hypothetical protein
MLTDIIIVLIIMGMSVGFMVQPFMVSKHMAPTVGGVYAMRTKINAVQTQQPLSLKIIDGRLQTDRHAHYTGLGDCTLVWTAKGTASKAGRCDGTRGRLSLRPGEGGIGFPW